MTLDAAPTTKSSTKSKAGAAGSKMRPPAKSKKPAKPANAAKASNTDKAQVAPDAGGKLRLMQFSDPAEIEFGMPLFREGFMSTRYSHLQFSEDKLRKRLEAVLARPKTNAAFYVMLGERAVGAIDVGLGEPYLATGAIVAASRSIFVADDIRTSLLGGKVAAILISTAKQWAKERGAVELMFYDRHGFISRLLKNSEIDGAHVAVKL